MKMSGKVEAINNCVPDRKRNSSRPKKGTVSDIKQAFKKQMENKSASINSSKKDGKSNKVNSNSDFETEIEVSKMKTRSTSAGNSKSGLQSQSTKESTTEHEHVHEGEHVQENSQEKSNYIHVETEHEKEEEGSEIADEIHELNDSTVDESEEDEDTLNRENRENANSDSDTASQDKLQSVKGTVTNEAVMEALTEIKSSLHKVEFALFDPREGLEPKLAKTMSTVRDLKDDIHSAASGLKKRMDSFEAEAKRSNQRLEQAEKSLTRMSKMLDENKKVAKQLVIMQGILQKFAQQGQVTSAKVLDLTKRGMEQNLIIHGINEGDPKKKEDCKQSVITFLNQYLELQAAEADIWKAHRMGGPPRTGNVRPMVIKVAYHLKETIMENVTKLKDQINTTTEKPLFISEQVPEGISEGRKQLGARLKTLREENDKLPEKDKRKIQVQNDKILVEGCVHEPEVLPPQPSDLFVDAEKQKQVDSIYNKAVMTEPVTVRNSEFVGIAVQTDTISEVNLAYTAVAQQFPSMDHIMMSYGLKENEVVKHGHCDDFEYGGGAAIRRVMAEERARNVSIFVIRKYGGLHLGLDRFKTIKQVAKNALFLLRQST